MYACSLLFFFFQAEDGIRDYKVTGVRRVLFRSVHTVRADGRTNPSPSRCHHLLVNLYLGGYNCAERTEYSENRNNRRFEISHKAILSSTRIPFGALTLSRAPNFDPPIGSTKLHFRPVKILRGSLGCKCRSITDPVCLAPSAASPSPSSLYGNRLLSPSA